MFSTMPVLVMYANPYEMKNEETGEIRRGLTVEYYIFGNGGQNMKAQASSDEGGSLGYRRMKSSMDITVKDKLMFVPGIYDGGFEMNVDKDGKPSLKLVDVDFVGTCSMSVDAVSDTKSETPAKGK